MLSEIVVKVDDEILGIFQGGILYVVDLEISLDADILCITVDERLCALTLEELMLV